MFKCLISAGCSFAYGFNLEQRDQRYSKIIADHMKVELIDTSAAGMTNEFIAAACMSGVVKALRKYKPEEILVLIGWTSTQRFEYYNKDRGRIMSGFINYRHHVNGNQSATDIARSKYMADNLWDPAYGYYKLIHAYNYINYACKAHGIKIINKNNLIFMPTRFPNVRMFHTDVRNPELIDGVLTPEFRQQLDQWMDRTSFQRFIMEHNYVIDGVRDTHPNAEGHAQWAKRLIVEHEEFNNL